MSEIRFFMPRIKIARPQNQEAHIQETQYNFVQQTNNYYGSYNITDINNNENIMQQNSKNIGNKVCLKSEALCKLKKKIQQQKAEEIEKEREIKRIKEEQKAERKAKEEKAQKAKVKQKLNTVLSKLEVSNQDEASEIVSHSDDFISNNNLLQNALKSFSKIENHTQQHVSIQTTYGDNLSNIQKLKPHAEKIKEQQQKQQEQQNYGALNGDIIFTKEIENDIILANDGNSIIDELSSSNGYTLSFSDS